jgi:hypothetical protein
MALGKNWRRGMTIANIPQFFQGPLVLSEKSTEAVARGKQSGEGFILKWEII